MTLSCVFSDPKQVMKWCLGSTAVGAQYGAVSALSFNRDCTRLLTGFAKGQVRIAFWSTIEDVSLCQCNEALQIKSKTAEKQQILCSVVFELSRLPCGI